MGSGGHTPRCTKGGMQAVSRKGQSGGEREACEQTQRINTRMVSLPNTQKHACADHCLSLQKD